jgi:hypothetical protein
MHPQATPILVLLVARAVVGRLEALEPRLRTVVTRPHRNPNMYVGRGGHGSGRRDGAWEEVHGGGNEGKG